MHPHGAEFIRKGEFIFELPTKDLWVYEPENKLEKGVVVRHSVWKRFPTNLDAVLINSSLIPGSTKCYPCQVLGTLGKEDGSWKSAILSGTLLDVLL